MLRKKIIRKKCVSDLKIQTCRSSGIINAAKDKKTGSKVVWDVMMSLELSDCRLKHQRDVSGFGALLRPL